MCRIAERAGVALGLVAGSQLEAAGVRVGRQILRTSVPGAGDLRYGDAPGETIDLSMGCLNAIWQGDANAAVLHDWVARTPWIENLAVDKATWSNTGVCLVVRDADVSALPVAEQAAFAKAIVATLEKEGVGVDLGSYRDAPPGLRIWTGSTIEKADVEALLPWLDWAFADAKSKLRKAA